MSWLPWQSESAQEARTNRAKVKAGVGKEFYAMQAKAVAQWGLGEKKPDSVILGDLPYAGKVGRQVEREEYYGEF